MAGWSIGLNSLSDAQELAQDAYLRLLTLKSPEHIDSLRAYLFRIATNLATDRLRTHKVRSDSPPEQAAADFRLSPNDTYGLSSKFVTCIWL